MVMHPTKYYVIDHPLLHDLFKFHWWHNNVTIYKLSDFYQFKDIVNSAEDFGSHAKISCIHSTYIYMWFEASSLVNIIVSRK